jgi:hypothetical protein
MNQTDSSGVVVVTGSSARDGAATVILWIADNYRREINVAPPNFGGYPRRQSSPACSTTT